MIEYPSITGPSKAPRKEMIAFEKLDGSNIRVKWTPKRSFHLFGSRTQLLDATHQELGGVVSVFNSTCRDALETLLRKKFSKEREVVVYGEYLGPNSFAGAHADPPDQMRFVLFDILLNKKTGPEFVSPQEFVKLTAGADLPTPKVVYEGVLGEAFINRVRQNDFDPPLDEGVVCKGRIRTNAYSGGVWMCKIKTLQYREQLMARYGADWVRYWE